jgi:hypothetical protein
LIVPGPIQTADYARSLFLAAGSDEDQAEEQVEVRLGRQAIFDRPDPPHIVIVLDEAVLHRLIGSPAIMADQLEHIALASKRPNVSVHVLPSENGANAGLGGGFSIASCDGMPDTLRMEAVEDQTVDGRVLVRKAAVVFDLVRRDALPRGASRTVVLEAAEQWKTR